MGATGEWVRTTMERARRACAISRLRVCARSGDGLGSEGKPVGRALGRDGDAAYRSDARRASVARDGSSGSGVASARRGREESGEEGDAEAGRGFRSGER